MWKKTFLIILLVVTIAVTSCMFIQEDTIEHEKIYYTHSLEVTSEQMYIHVEKSEMQYKSSRIQDVTVEERNNAIIESVFLEINGAESTDLTQYGIYEMSVKITENIPLVEDIKMTQPTLLYDAKYKQWIVVCAGKWINPPNRTIGGNLGRNEYFGVELIAKENQFTSCVLDSYAFISDNNMENIVSTDLRTYGEVSNGFVFGIQDYVLGGLKDKVYIGSFWFGMCIYDESFSSGDYTMRSLYIHTS